MTHQIGGGGLCVCVCVRACVCVCARARARAAASSKLQGEELHISVSEIWPANYHFHTPGMNNRTKVLIIMMCIWVTTYDIITLYVHCTFIVNNLCGIWGYDNRLMSCRMLWHAVWWKFTNVVWKPTDFLNPKDGGSESLENIGKCLWDHIVSHTRRQ